MGAGLNEIRPMPFVAVAPREILSALQIPGRRRGIPARDADHAHLEGRYTSRACRQRSVVEIELRSCGRGSAALLARRMQRYAEKMHVAALVRGHRGRRISQGVQPSYDEWDIKFPRESRALPFGRDDRAGPSTVRFVGHISERRDCGCSPTIKIDAPVWAKPAFGRDNLGARDQVVAKTSVSRHPGDSPRTGRSRAARADKCDGGANRCSHSKGSGRSAGKSYPLR